MHFFTESTLHKWSATSNGEIVENKDWLSRFRSADELIQTGLFIILEYV